ncbi:MAG TPA: signal peptidase I [Thermoanaerobaculia bacterium]|jgi:signal peptidase I
MRKTLIITAIVLGVLGFLLTAGNAIMSYQGRTFTYSVRNGDMRPTLVPGEMIVANPFAYVSNEPRRGDLVICRYPGEKYTRDVARIVGLPGETVEVRQTRVFINGRALEEPHAYHEDSPDLTEEVRRRTDDVAPVVVPPKHHYVMGDNRRFANDSRFRGPVPRRQLLARIIEF